MTRTERITHITARLCVAGGVAWLAKLVVLAATGGGESAPVAVLYLAGAALLVLGSPALGLWLTRRRGTAARVAAAVVSPFAMITTFSLLDGILKPMLEDSGPSWMSDEWGILPTALLWLGLGVAVLRRRPVGAAPNGPPANARAA